MTKEEDIKKVADEFKLLSKGQLVVFLTKFTDIELNYLKELITDELKCRGHSDNPEVQKIVEGIKNLIGMYEYDMEVYKKVSGDLNNISYIEAVCQINLLDFLLDKIESGEIFEEKE